MNKCLELYTKTFGDLGIVVHEDGNLHTRSGKPVKIDGREVVLPMEQYLLKNEWDELFPWHPISENEILGPSLPIIRYSAYLKVTTHVALVEILETLIKLVQQPALQENLKGTRLIRVLSELPKVSDKQIDDVRKALNRYLKHLSKENISPITLKLSRVKGGKTADGIRATRKATLLTNYTELDDPASYHKHCSTLSKAGKDFIDRLFEVTDLGTILYGDGTAPYYQSLLKVHKAIIEKLKPYLDEVASIKEETHVPKGEWFDMIDDLKGMSLEIVSLPGNEGVPLEETFESRESDPLDNVSEPKRNKPAPEPVYEPSRREEKPTERTTSREPEHEESTPRKRGEVDLDVMDHIRFLDGGGRSGGDPYLDDRDRHAPRDRYVDADDDRDRGRGGRDRYHETEREREDRLYYEEQDRRRREEEDRRYRDDRYHDDRYRDDRYRDDRYRDDRYRDDHSGGRYPARDPYVDEDRGRRGTGGGGRGDRR